MLTPVDQLDHAELNRELAERLGFTTKEWECRDKSIVYFLQYPAPWDLSPAHATTAYTNAEYALSSVPFTTDANAALWALDQVAALVGGMWTLASGNGKALATICPHFHQFADATSLAAVRVCLAVLREVQGGEV